MPIFISLHPSFISEGTFIVIEIHNRKITILTGVNIHSGAMSHVMVNLTRTRELWACTKCHYVWALPGRYVC